MNKILSLLVACLFVIGAHAQSGKLRQAQQKMDNLEYMAAIEIYNQILEDGDVAEAKINLAEAYRKAGHKPKGYSGKIDLKLDPSMTADQALRVLMQVVYKGHALSFAAPLMVWLLAYGPQLVVALGQRHADLCDWQGDRARLHHVEGLPGAGLRSSPRHHQRLVGGLPRGVGR